MKSSIKYTLFAFVAAVIAVSLGGFLYYEKYYLPTQQAQISASNMAYTAYNSGDYTRSIDNLRSLLPTAPTKTERGRLQVVLASALIARNQAGDVSEASTILKKIVNDYSIASWVRALALNNIATVVAINNTSFYKQNFAEAPFDAYLGTSGDDQAKVKTAYYNILKSSDETYPTSFAELSIAGNYLVPHIANGNVTAEEASTTAKLMQQYVHEADTRNDGTLYSTSNVLYEVLYRALALTSSGRILNNISLDEREQAYKRIFAIADYQKQIGSNSADTTVSTSVLLRARFWYASFLVGNYGKTRDADVIALLAPFAQGASSNPYLGSLLNLKNVADTNFTKQQAVALAKISPDFKKFLVETGLQAQ